MKKFVHYTIIEIKDLLNSVKNSTSSC